MALLLMCPDWSYDHVVKNTIMTDCANPINLQPMHQFRKVFADEKGDGSEYDGDDDSNMSDFDPYGDDGDDEMMADFTEDGPEDPPLHESTGLGQTESDSFNLNLEDSLDGSSLGPPGNDTPTAQSKTDEGAQKSFSFSSQRGSRRGSSEADEGVPTSFNFRKPRSRKTSTRTPTSSRHSSPTSSAASSRRPSRSRSSSRRRSSTQDSLSEAMNSECFRLMYYSTVYLLLCCFLMVHV